MINLRGEEREPMSDINFIPFIDILLVILVIFMVATPILMESAIKVALPHARASSATTREPGRITITVTESGSVYVDEVELSDVSQLEAALTRNHVEMATVVLSADRKAPYGIVAKALGLAQDLGAQKLELSVIPDQSSK